MTRATQPTVERCSLDALDGTARPFDDGEPDVVRLHLDAGESVAPHAHPGRSVVFFGVEGAFEVRVGDERRRVTAGDCLRFDGDEEVSPRATADGPATALVVLAKR